MTSCTLYATSPARVCKTRPYSGPLSATSPRRWSRIWATLSRVLGAQCRIRRRPWARAYRSCPPSPVSLPPASRRMRWNTRIKIILGHCTGRHPTQAKSTPPTSPPLQLGLDVCRCRCLLKGAAPLQIHLCRKMGWFGWPGFWVVRGMRSRQVTDRDYIYFEFLEGLGRRDGI